MHAEVDHRDAVRVVQPAHRHRFALEPATKPVVLDQRLVQHLDRHHAVELHAARAVDHADAAVADDLEQLVAIIEHLADER